MFDSIRKHQRVLQFVLLLLILPAFVFFGVSGYQGFIGDDGRVATVGGEPISRQEFEQAQRRQVDQMRQMFGEQIDPKMLDTEQSRTQIVDELVTQKALLIEARNKRLSVSNEQLRTMISAIPGLQKPDGSFDLERYRALLSAQGLNEVVFEADMRRDLASRTLPETLSQTGLVPRAVLDRLVGLQEEAREVRSLMFKAADQASKVKVDEAQLKRFYEENATMFEAPESAKIEYLVLDVEALIPRVAVDAEKLKTYYEQNVARYTSAEQRQASHILITFPRDGNEDARKAARGKAEGLLAQIRSGGDFGTLAKAQSQDPGSASRGGDLGYFDREMMVKPFADATWNLKLNEVSGLVESEFGYHIIKLTGIKPGVQRPYESVRAEIEQEYRRQEAGREFAKAAEQFTNLVYEQADSLKPAAERFKLEVRTMEGLTRGGPPPSASGQKSPLSNAKLLGELFSADSLKSRRNTDAVEVSTNMLVSARIVDYMPAQRKPLEAVKTEVQQRIVARESSRLAMEAGETRLKELTSGGADTGFGPAQTVRRSDGAQSKIPSAALEKIFKAPTSKLPRFVGVDLGAEGYGLYELRSVTAATQAQIDAKRPMYEEQFAQFVSQQEVAAYLESLKARAKVKKNPTAIAKKD